MSFLSIAFLTALPLAAAPILLHLFDRRRNVVIEWGAMQFLMEAATHQHSARRVQHWLLLMLRMAALAALVLALAQPMLPGDWFGSGRGETILVLDNSMSTARSVDGTPLFDKLVTRAEALLEEADAQESVRILIASPYPMWLSHDGVLTGAAGRSDLKQRLRELRPTLAASDLPGALMKAVHSEPKDAALQTRRIVVLTDGQAADWKIEDLAAWTRFHDAVDNAHVPTTLDLHLDDNLGQGNNLAVNRVRASRTVVGVDQPFTVTAEIQNHSLTESAPCSITWLIDDAVGHESQLPPVAAGATHDAAWRHSFSRTGVFTLTCRVDADDDLLADNTESLVVEVVERVPVLLVEGSAEFAEMQQDAYLVQAALGWIEGEEPLGWQAVFQPRTVSPQRLETIELDDFRAVVVPNLTQLSAKAVARLTDFVSHGGGLWLALGSRTDVPQFNRHLFNDGDGLSPVGIDQLVDESLAGPRSATINPFLKKHPATMELADDERLDTGDVKVTRRYRFRMPDGFAHVPVLLDLSNGEPLVVEKQVGQGRVIVQAVPLRLQWSDLAVSQAFVVMVQDWLSYLTEPRATRHNLTPGHPISVQVATGDDVQATLTLPDGHDVLVTGEPVHGGVLFRTSHTVLPGHYSLDVGVPGEPIAFHVARDASESDLAGLTPADRAFLADVAGLGGSPSGDRTADRRGGAKRYNPVWPALLVLLIVLIAGELWLSGAIARKRFGTAGIPEAADPSTASELAVAISPTASSFDGNVRTPAEREPHGSGV